LPTFRFDALPISLDASPPMATVSFWPMVSDRSPVMVAPLLPSTDRS
jgi:hypothetical protein